ncbi:MAG: TauD/TfdA family dioxygenase [Acidimicrobiia bacterium]|nr:TauD/TfdA family dioxygenase [Acidimicrobiia bacterium]
MSINAERLTPALGADVTGLDPSADITADVAQQLHSLLMEHQVIFMRDMDLPPRRMAALGESLGTLGARHHSYVTHEESDDVVILEWKDDDTPDAAEWHADMTYRASPPFASILKAVVVPPSGGDTLWASMYSVYDSLPEGMKADLAELQAVHDMGAFRTPAFLAGGDEGILEAYNNAKTATHPMISHHPVTGRPYLNVSESFTRFVIGLSAPESGRLLTELFDRINRPEHHVRLRWKPNTIAIWDNRGTQHYAVVDYLPHRRVMHRVAVVEDARQPVS